MEKVESHNLSKRHRSEIEGCLSAENSAMVICMAKAEFRFPYEVDVHNILSTELMGKAFPLIKNHHFLYKKIFLPGIFKWLKSLHGKTSTDWNAVNPDILIFAKEIAVEVQVKIQSPLL